ncbi:hypothetical protein GH733_018958, partial [Mirounga leonina]
MCPPQGSHICSPCIWATLYLFTSRRLGRRGRRRHPGSFATHFPRVLRNVHDGLSLSQEAVSVMDSFVKDIFERITSEASHLVRTTKRSTITSREIQTA